MRPHGPKQAEIWAVGERISVGSMANSSGLTGLGRIRSAMVMTPGGIEGEVDGEAEGLWSRVAPGQS